MAYICEYQNELQSTSWSRNSVQLFTGAVFYSNECKTYLVCSDTKDKDNFYCIIEELYGVFMSENCYTDAETLFTDGPSSEFIMKLI